MAIITISVNEEFEQKIKQMFKDSGYSNFSAFVAERIRDGLDQWAKGHLTQP